MDLLNEIKQLDLSKPTLEQVVREQTEFTLLGTYQISKGFTLFAYNSLTGKIRLPEIKRGEFIQGELVKFKDGNPDGEWIWFDPENMNTTIDSKEIYFEAVNLKFAESRVKKFKEGKIKDLFNLKKPSNNTINIFEYI